MPPLFEAIEAGDPDQVSLALNDCKAYEDLNRCDDSYETPLMKAAWCKGEHRKRILQLIWVKHLQLKGDLQEALSRKDDDGFTVLMHAALSEDEETLKLVLGFYKHVFQDLKFLKLSISSADLPEAEKKSLTKKIGNCLATLSPVKKAPTTTTPTTTTTSNPQHNTNGMSQPILPKDNALPDSTVKDEFYATSSSESSQGGDDDEPTTVDLSGDIRDELLTTLECMKTLAKPLHDAIRKGKAGPPELAKMESIMMLMGSMQDVLSPDAWQTI